MERLNIEKGAYLRRAWSGVCGMQNISSSSRSHAEWEKRSIIYLKKIAERQKEKIIAGNIQTALRFRILIFNLAFHML